MDSNKIQFFDFVKNLDFEFSILMENNIILFEQKSLAFYFHETNIEKPQFFFKGLIEQFSQQNIRLIIIYEFQWVNNQLIIRSRIESMFDKSISIHGRKTKFVRIDKAKAEKFLAENHLQGYVSAKLKYGLFLNEKLVAVATFSAGRKKKEMPENLRSFELIRFANKSGFRVIGGLSKLIKGFVQNHNVGDIMTYVDSAWSDGTGYQKLGFERTDFLEPFNIFEKDNSTEIPVWNAGSLKLVLDTRNFKIKQTTN